MNAHDRLMTFYTLFWKVLFSKLFTFLWLLYFT